MIVARLQVPECSPTETSTPSCSYPVTPSMETVKAARIAVKSRTHFRFDLRTMLVPS